MVMDMIHMPSAHQKAQREEEGEEGNWIENKLYSALHGNN